MERRTERVRHHLQRSTLRWPITKQTTPTHNETLTDPIPSLVPLSRGDVVVFTDPGGWLPPSMEKINPIDAALSVVGLGASDSNNHLVKRVIGLTGDHVVCCNALGQVTVNGVAVMEPYLKSPALPAARPFDVVVSAGSIWVLSDNRQGSADSRVHVSDGPRQKALYRFRMWSVERLCSPGRSISGQKFQITLKCTTRFAKPSDRFTARQRRRIRQQLRCPKKASRHQR